MFAQIFALASYQNQKSRFFDATLRLVFINNLWQQLVSVIKYKKLASFSQSFSFVIYLNLPTFNTNIQLFSGTHGTSLTDSPYFYLWILSSVISSLYCYLWDIKMDWGLFDSKAGENKFLREEIVYSTPVRFCPFFSLVSSVMYFQNIFTTIILLKLLKL